MIRGTLQIVGGPYQMLKEWPRIMKESLTEVLLNWHRETLPKHFLPQACYIYNYPRRTPKYEAKKRRKGLPPLVWSGRTKRELMSQARITATAKKGRLAMDAPKYFWMRTKTGIDKGDEVTRVTPGEIRAMAVMLSEQVAKGIDKLRERRSYG